jgi:hypothetical protein
LPLNYQWYVVNAEPNLDWNTPSFASPQVQGRNTEKVLVEASSAASRGTYCGMSVNYATGKTKQDNYSYNDERMGII